MTPVCQSKINSRVFIMNNPGLPGIRPCWSRAAARTSPSLRNHASRWRSAVRSGRNVGKVDEGIYNPCWRAKHTGTSPGMSASRPSALTWRGCFQVCELSFVETREHHTHTSITKRRDKNAGPTNDLPRCFGVNKAEHVVANRLQSTRAVRPNARAGESDEPPQKKNLPTMHCGVFQTKSRGELS